jgi:hypothetical protein
MSPENVKKLMQLCKSKAKKNIEHIVTLDQEERKPNIVVLLVHIIDLKKKS